MTLRRLPAMAWTVVIIALCLAPSAWFGFGDGSGDGPSLLDRWFGPLFGELPYDKVVHFGMFAAFGLLWRWAGARERSTLLGGLVLAVGTELGQSIPALQRTTDLDDLIANLLGLTLAVAAFRLVRPESPEPAPRPEPEPEPDRP